jgi:hypothetical protein
MITPQAPQICHNNSSCINLLRYNISRIAIQNRNLGYEKGWTMCSIGRRGWIPNKEVRPILALAMNSKMGRSERKVFP